MGRMFGTDGVRGIANTELTSEIAYGLGRAGAYVLTEGTHKPKILVAKDTRISGDMLEAALVSGILSVGAEAVILGVVPTPAVAHLIREYNADAGIMISASHNPVEYNGIKFFDNKGYKLQDELEDEIQRVIESDFEFHLLIHQITYIPYHQKTLFHYIQQDYVMLKSLPLRLLHIL